MLLFDSDIGRLGNQMFMYAAARAFSKIKKAQYAITDFRKLKYFKLTTEDYVFNELKKAWFKYRIQRYGLMKSLDLTDCWKDHYSDFLTESGHRKVIGYFQGEWYFKQFEDDIRKAFEVKNKHRQRFLKVYKKHMQAKKVVVVHIRRTDYLEHNWDSLGGSGFALPLSYYKKQVDALKESSAKFIFVSDDISFAEKNFSYLKNAWFSHEDEITDMQIIMHGDVCILSNSSFSWWGGWLNKKKNKQIFMPKYYCGFKVKKEYPVNIIPASFHTVDVDLSEVLEPSK